MQIMPPSCDETTYPPIPTPFGAPREAGTGDDGGADAAATDGAAAADAGDAGTADAAVDAAATGDGAAADAAVDAGSTTPTGPLPCYAFLYNPAPAGGWAGTIFESTAAGGNASGVCVTPGATTITFWAKSSRDMARVKFGSIRDGVGSFEFWLMLTTSWAQYTISIPAMAPYNDIVTGTAGVWNGFSVVFEPQDHMGGTYVFVKNVVWSNGPLDAGTTTDASGSDASGSDSSSTDSSSSDAAQDASGQ
jgi:hypothetical protein